MKREEFEKKHELKYFGFPTQHEAWKADIKSMLKEYMEEAYLEGYHIDPVHDRPEFDEWYDDNF